jgi:chromosome segregation ATPase
MIPPATLDILNRTGITLNDLAAALEDDAAMANLVTAAEQALNTSTSEGYWQYFWLLKALVDLNRAYDEAAEELRIQEEAERRAVAQEQAHETMARKLAGATQTLEGNFRTSTGTAAEWTTVLEKARQRVIDLAKAQLEAASPALQVIRARQAHAEAEQRLADLQSQRGQNVAEIREAELNVIETEGRLQAAQGLLTTQLGESTSAFRQLAEDAGFYGDELERIVGLLWDYDKAPKPGPSPYLQEGPL